MCNCGFTVNAHCIWCAWLTIALNYKIGKVLIRISCDERVFECVLLLVCLLCVRLCIHMMHMHIYAGVCVCACMDK